MPTGKKEHDCLVLTQFLIPILSWVFALTSLYHHSSYGYAKQVLLWRSLTQQREVTKDPLQYTLLK